jgi:hypothetical protein
VRAKAALLALALLATLLLAGSTPTRAAVARLHLVVVGDSIAKGYGSSDGQGWRSKLIADVAASGTELTITSYAVGGWGTADALPGLGTLLLDKDPDLVLIALGTNDALGDIGLFEWRYNWLLNVAIDICRAKVAVAFLGYPAGLLGVRVGYANDAIWRASYAHGFMASPRPARFAGFVDFQVIPHADLDAGGIHPRDIGYAAMAHQIERVLGPAYGWAAPPADVPALTGRRP